MSNKKLSSSSGWRPLPQRYKTITLVEPQRSLPSLTMISEQTEQFAQVREVKNDVEPEIRRAQQRVEVVEIEPEVVLRHVGAKKEQEPQLLLRQATVKREERLQMLNGRGKVIHRSMEKLDIIGTPVNQEMRRRLQKERGKYREEKNQLIRTTLRAYIPKMEEVKLQSAKNRQELVSRLKDWDGHSRRDIQVEQSLLMGINTFETPNGSTSRPLKRKGKHRAESPLHAVWLFNPISYSGEARNLKSMQKGHGLIFGQDHIPVYDTYKFRQFEPYKIGREADVIIFASHGHLGSVILEVPYEDGWEDDLFSLCNQRSKEVQRTWGSFTLSFFIPHVGHSEELQAILYRNKFVFLDTEGRYPDKYFILEMVCSHVSPQAYLCFREVKRILGCSHFFVKGGEAEKRRLEADGVHTTLYELDQKIPWEQEPTPHTPYGGIIQMAVQVFSLKWGSYVHFSYEEIGEMRMDVQYHLSLGDVIQVSPCHWGRVCHYECTHEGFCWYDFPFRKGQPDSVDFVYSPFDYKLAERQQKRS